MSSFIILTLLNTIVATVNPAYNSRDLTSPINTKKYEVAMTTGFELRHKTLMINLSISA